MAKIKDLALTSVLVHLLILMHKRRTASSGRILYLRDAVFHKNKHRLPVHRLQNSPGKYTEEIKLAIAA